MKHSKKYSLLIITIVVIAIILFLCWYFKIFPFNEEQFKLENETCYKTCINTTEQPFVRTSILDDSMYIPVSSPVSPKVEIPLAPTKTVSGAIPTPPTLNTPSTNLNVKPQFSEKNMSSLLSDIRKGTKLNTTSSLVKPIDNSIIPQAPTKTITGAIPTPPILNTPSTNLNVKSSLLDSTPSLLNQIRNKDFQLKSTPPIQKKETSSSNPLLDQIRNKDFKLKSTPMMLKENTIKSSPSPLVTTSLQDEIAKRISSRRQYIEDDTDSFDEFFRYHRYG